MEEVKHESMAAWVGALKAAKGKKHYLVKSDDVLRRMFGFIDHTDEKHHFIGITELKAGIGNLPEDVRVALVEPSDRHKLIEGEGEV